MALESSESPREVTKIHLLVHPGFVSNELDRSILAREPVEEYMPELAHESEKLLGRILDHARNMPRKEIMIVLTDGRRSELGGRMPYARFIGDLRGVLGRRLIVLTDPHFESLGVDTNERMFGDFQKIAAARGFLFAADTPLEAYGETSGHCVPRALDAFKTRGRFKGETTINRSLTNESFDAG